MARIYVGFWRNIGGHAVTSDEEWTGIVKYKKSVMLIV